MKRLFILALTALLCFTLLTACGSAGDEAPTAAPTDGWNHAVDGYRVKGGVLRLNLVSDDFVGVWGPDGHLDADDNWIVVVVFADKGVDVSDLLDNRIKVKDCSGVTYRSEKSVDRVTVTLLYRNSKAIPLQDIEVDIAEDVPAYEASRNQ